VGMVQVTSPNHMFWMMPDATLLGRTEESEEPESVIPDYFTLQDLCAAATIISLHIRQPYMRIDFAASTQGAMFRSFACVPGDIRAEQFRWFYSQHDEHLGELWEAAEQRIKEDHANANSAGPEPVQPAATPDDNA